MLTQWVGIASSARTKVVRSEGIARCYSLGRGMDLGLSVVVEWDRPPHERTGPMLVRMLLVGVTTFAFAAPAVAGTVTAHSAGTTATITAAIMGSRSTTAAITTPTTAADRAMATAGPDRRLIAIAFAAALAIAGCGAGAPRSHAPAAVRVAAAGRRAHRLERGPAAVANGAARLPAGLAHDRHGPRDVLGCAAGSPRAHSWLPQRDAAIRRGDARQLGAVPRRPQPRGGRPRGRAGELCDRAAIPFRDGLVRGGPLPHRDVRALPGDRVHRARGAGDHGRRRRSAAARLGCAWRRSCAQRWRASPPQSVTRTGSASTP